MRRSRASSTDLVAGIRTGVTRHPGSLPVKPAESACVEVTIAISHPAADLVSSLFFESGATAIAVMEGACLRLRTHLPDDPTLGRKIGRITRYLSSLGSLGIDVGPGRVTTRRFRDHGWATRWKDFFRPMRVGKRLVIKPSWDATAVRAGKIVIELDPGMAFGTGQHPTTRMCLELLEEAMEEFTVHRSQLTDGTRPRGFVMRRQPSTVNRGPVVLDLGTGSGVLAIAAFRFGAGKVLALDIDSVACRIAAENIRRNGGDGRIVVKHGTLAAARTRTFDVVLANLTAEELIGLAPRLERSVRPGRRLIISGILRKQERGVKAAFRSCGLRFERARRGREWVALMFRPPGASPDGSV